MCSESEVELANDDDDDDDDVEEEEEEEDEVEEGALTVSKLRNPVFVGEIRSHPVRRLHPVVSGPRKTLLILVTFA